MRRVRWLDAREAAAWRALQLMHMRLNAQLARELAETSELSYQDYVVLVVLTDRPGGIVRQFELAEMLGWERSRLSHHLSRMEERGLVRKERCAADRRGAFVAVTEAGREEIRAAAPDHVASVRRHFVDRLSPAQLEAVRDVAESILAGLEEACDGSPARAGAPEYDEAVTGEVGGVGGSRVNGRTPRRGGRRP